MSPTTRRFPPPWTVQEHEERFTVCDATGQPLAYLYFEDERTRRGSMKRLTRDEARRIAAGIARLPDVLQHGFVVGEDWKPTAENINALPEPLRAYIHWLSTDADPQGTIRENFLLRDENKALRQECVRLVSLHAANALLALMNVMLPIIEDLRQELLATMISNKAHSNAYAARRFRGTQLISQVAELSESANG